MIETFPRGSVFIKEDQRTRRWAIPYHYEALNSRVENLIVNQSDCIKGKKILDLGCHFGTFSFACLTYGADFVHGIDNEAGLIGQGKELFRKQQVSKNNYKFEAADVLTVLESLPAKSYDTILCLGIFYYLNDPLYALRQMARVAKKAVILDTFTAYYAATVAKDREKFLAGTNEATFDLPVVYYPLTKSQKKDYKLIKVSENVKGMDLSLIALPTIPALEQFFEICTLKAEKILWNDYINNNVARWQAFSDQNTKHTSHWADLYGNRIRVSYLLKK